MVEIEFTDPNQRVQKLIEYFDLNLERNLDFDINICFHGPDQNCEEEKNLKDLLDELIQNERGWDRISASCRRMIICDRKMDLEFGLKIFEKTFLEFQKLNPEDEPYEAIKYMNVCGLIHYRSGNYSQALKFFENANQMAKDKGMTCFIPDTESNIIRTKFEFFSQVIPDEISDTLAKKYKIILEEFVKSYENVIENYELSNIKNGKSSLIYGHGMASLHHNLAETYSKLSTKKGFNRLFDISYLIQKAKEENERSLTYGIEYGDIYRQLQSKRALSAVYKQLIAKYEEDVLNGDWQRGKLMIYQKRISGATDKEEVEKWVNKEDFILDINSEDKIGLLYNLNSIKSFLNNHPDTFIKVKNEKVLTLSKIADLKIEIAENLRKCFSPILYRRQVINLIRDDFIFKTNLLLEDDSEKDKQKKYASAIEFNEKYHSRSLTELSKIVMVGNFNPTDSQKKRIDDSKKKIYEKFRDEDLDDGHSISTSIDTKRLSADIRVDYLNLLFEYEDVLKLPVDQSNISEIIDEQVVSNLISRLEKIPEKDSTLVLKFLVIETKKVSFICGFFITKDGIKIEKVDIKFIQVVRETIDEIVKQQKNSKIPKKPNYTNLHSVMSEINKELKFKEFLKQENIKNVFIIPDGELFQFPLHLLNDDGQDLRKELNLYYSPSLTYLLSNYEPQTSNRNLNYKYLWVTSPYTHFGNLCENNVPDLDVPSVKTDMIDVLKCKNATIEKLNWHLENIQYSHIGLSTHSMFQNDSEESYASNLIFSGSFMTFYDILLSRYDFSGVQTIFIGACSGGACKVTDENEAVGLVTSLLSKKARSVIAPLWPILVTTHNDFISVVNKKSYLDRSQPWNISNILHSLNETEAQHLIPFVQFASMEFVENLE